MLILLSGKRYSGKSFVADVLSSNFGYTELALADGVKMEAAKRLSSSDAETQQIYARLIQDQQFKDANRSLLIDIGQSVRSKDQDHWCDKLERNMILMGKGNYVISDIRLPNEIEYFKSRYDCVTIRVVASEETRSLRGHVPSSLDCHVTECGVDNYPMDYTINNDTNGMDHVIEELSCILTP